MGRDDEGRDDEGRDDDAALATFDAGGYLARARRLADLWPTRRESRSRVWRPTSRVPAGSVRMFSTASCAWPACGWQSSTPRDTRSLRLLRTP